MTGAALYEASVRHVRRRQVSTSFTHRYYLWLVDLDALPRLPLPLRPFARFDARDHCGDPERGLRENVDAWLADLGIDLRGGRVSMLAAPRVLGYVFNPLTLYWCHRRDGSLECVVAEVHNTYGERHRYLLRTDGRGDAAVDKDFYVSPFLDIDGYYRMHVPEPGERLAVTVSLHQNGENSLTAVLTGTRRVLRARELTRMILRYPLSPQRVAVAIRRHGIALWLRGVAIAQRPATRSREEATS